MGRGEAAEQIGLEAIDRFALEAALPDLDAIDRNRGPRLLAEVAEALEAAPIKNGVEDLAGLLDPLAGSETALRLLAQDPLHPSSQRIYQALAAASYFDRQEPTLERLWRQAALDLAVELPDTQLIVRSPLVPDGRKLISHLRAEPNDPLTLCCREIGEEWLTSSPRGSFTDTRTSSAVTAGACVACRIRVDKLDANSPVVKAATELVRFHPLASREALDHYHKRLLEELQDGLFDALEDGQPPVDAFASLLTDPQRFARLHAGHLSLDLAQHFLDLSVAERFHNLFLAPLAESKDGLATPEELEPALARLGEIAEEQYELSQGRHFWPSGIRYSSHAERALLQTALPKKLALIASLTADLWPDAAQAYLSEIEQLDVLDEGSWLLSQQLREGLQQLGAKP